MPYHPVTITNTETGEVEEFLARISPQGVGEWLDDRAALLAAGKPDRPPDVDTDTLRLWLPWPGEENLPYFVNQREMVASTRRTAIAVYGVSWVGHGAQCGGRDRWAALHMHAYPDAEGGYVVAFGSNDQSAMPAMEKAYPSDVPDEQVWAEVEEFVARINEADWCGVKVTTYLDTQWFEAETMLAQAEIARGFLALPEGRA
jgi:hypothetical protein